MDTLVTVFRIVAIWFVVAVIMASIIAIISVMRRLDNYCCDSPDGEHHDIHVTTVEGWRLACQWCGRMTSGINAFHRKA